MQKSYPMQKNIITLLFFLCVFGLMAHTDDPVEMVYQYSVNLNEVENDQLKVELKVPPLIQAEHSVSVKS